MYIFFICYLCTFCNVMTSLLVSSTTIKLSNSKGSNEKSMRQENSFWHLWTVCWVRFLVNMTNIFVRIQAHYICFYEAPYSDESWGTGGKSGPMQMMDMHDGVE